MLSKVWEVSLLAIVVCLAGKLIVTTLAPFLPVIITVAILISIVGTLFNRKRRW